LRGRVHLGSALGNTLVRVHEWAASVVLGGLDVSLNGTSGKLKNRPAVDVIRTIAEYLTAGQPSPERELLSKSLQEALFDCTGIDPDITYPQLQSRFIRFLEQRGISFFVQRFLSLALFNLVWFQVGESFRALALTQDSFESDIEGVEWLCNRIVASSWRSSSLMQRPLDRSRAEELIRTIEQRLLGAG
jgi:hypothetical protein